MLKDIRRLYAYDAWAVARITAALKSFPHESRKALNLLAHLLVSEQIWLLRVQGKDTSAINKSPELSLADCESLAAEMRQAYTDFLSSLDEADLDAPVTYKNFKGDEYHTPLRDILQHVANHGAYHRGQIALALRADNLTPVDTDFITFVREVQ
ncbi:MAG: DinB family protein [Acidobacteria bacterium]|nr:DinB family protein [Acidobacteriota bacterium]